jgi:hypothetical protein
MNLKDFYSLLARLLLGYVFFSSGLCKLADGHFGQIIGPPFLIADLEPHRLGGFGIFLAFSQVMTGALVLSQRWSLLGLVMLVPMNVSILAATISMGWSGTPYVNGFLLLINLLALMYEWKTLRFFLNPENTATQLPTRTHQLFPDFWLALGVLLVAFLAAATARFLHPVMISAGVATLVLAWVNVWRSIKTSWLPKTVLAASLLAIVSLSLTEPLSAFQLNAQLPLLLGIAIASLATATLTLRFWFSKNPKMC